MTEESAVGRTYAGRLADIKDRIERSQVGAGPPLCRLSPSRRHYLPIHVPDSRSSAEINNPVYFVAPAWFR